MVQGVVGEHQAMGSFLGRSRAAEALAWSLPAAVLWVLPHFFGVFGPSGAHGDAGACLVLLPGAALTLAVTSLAVRPRDEGAGPSTTAVTLALAAPFIAAVAYWVATATHHRPLGAVFFSVCCALVTVAVSFVAARLVLGARRSARGSAWLASCSRLLLLVEVLGVVAIAVGDEKVSSELTRQRWDLGLGILLLLVLRLAPLPRLRLSALRWAIPAHLMLWVVAAIAPGSTGSTQALQSSPVLAGFSGVLFR